MLYMVIADETDEAAMAKWELYNGGADRDALAHLLGEAARRHHGADTSHGRGDPAPDVADQLQHGDAGRLLRHGRAHAGRVRRSMPATKGIMLTFDDFLVGMEQFGQRIQPLMACRSHLKLAA